MFETTFTSPNVIKTYDPNTGRHIIAISKKRLVSYVSRPQNKPFDGLGRRYTQLQLTTGYLDIDDEFTEYLSGWEFDSTSYTDANHITRLAIHEEIPAERSVTDAVGMQDILSAFLIRFGVGWNPAYLEPHDEPLHLEAIHMQIPDGVYPPDHSFSGEGITELEIRTNVDNKSGAINYRATSRVASAKATSMKIDYNWEKNLWELSVEGERYRIDHALFMMKDIFGNDIMWLARDTSKYDVRLSHEIFKFMTAHQLLVAIHYFLTGMCFDQDTVFKDKHIRLTSSYRDLNYVPTYRPHTR